eukprot:TRINITY_DN25947_c0_g1_i3.p1 TRINITY_DN25947_c0_g1~~TRINITY_DN25947_c0_g1_i3.p1  ORF type:complete len:941 (-),score=292.80 TRINITY_DN25947_c0_g1_i3:46-2868(-)
METAAELASALKAAGASHEAVLAAVAKFAGDAAVAANSSRDEAFRLLASAVGQAGGSIMDISEAAGAFASQSENGSLYERARSTLGAAAETARHAGASEAEILALLGKISIHSANTSGADVLSVASKWAAAMRDQVGEYATSQVEEVAANITASALAAQKASCLLLGTKTAEAMLQAGAAEADASRRGALAAASEAIRRGGTRQEAAAVAADVVTHAGKQPVAEVVSAVAFVATRLAEQAGLSADAVAADAAAAVRTLRGAGEMEALRAAYDAAVDVSKGAGIAASVALDEAARAGVLNAGGSPEDFAFLCAQVAAEEQQAVGALPADVAQAASAAAKAANGSHELATDCAARFAAAAARAANWSLGQLAEVVWQAVDAEGAPVAVAARQALEFAHGAALEGGLNASAAMAAAVAAVRDTDSSPQDVARAAGYVATSGAASDDLSAKEAGSVAASAAALAGGSAGDVADAAGEAAARLALVHGASEREAVAAAQKAAEAMNSPNADVARVAGAAAADLARRAGCPAAEVAEAAAAAARAAAGSELDVMKAASRAAAAAYNMSGNRTGDDLGGLAKAAAEAAQKAAGNTSRGVVNASSGPAASQRTAVPRDRPLKINAASQRRRRDLAKSAAPPAADGDRQTGEEEEGRSIDGVIHQVGSRRRLAATAGAAGKNYVVLAAFTIFHLDVSRLDEAQMEDLRRTLAFYMAKAAQVDAEHIQHLDLTAVQMRGSRRSSAWRVDATFSVPAAVLPTFVQRNLVGVEGGAAVAHIVQDVQAIAGVQSAMTGGFLYVSHFRAVVALRGKIESQLLAQRQLDALEDAATKERLSSELGIEEQRLTAVVTNTQQRAAEQESQSWHDWLEDVQIRGAGYLLPMCLSVVLTVPLAMCFAYLCIQVDGRRRLQADTSSLAQACVASGAALTGSSGGRATLDADLPAESTSSQ